MGGVENIVGKRRIAGNQHFSPFPTMFLKGFVFKVVKSRDCVERVKQTTKFSTDPNSN